MLESSCMRLMSLARADLATIFEIEGGITDVEVGHLAALKDRPDQG